jgi:hypothetical protein
LTLYTDAHEPQLYYSDGGRGVSNETASKQHSVNEVLDIIFANDTNDRPLVFGRNYVTDIASFLRSNPDALIIVTVRYVD